MIDGLEPDPHPVCTDRTPPAIHCCFCERPPVVIIPIFNSRARAPLCAEHQNIPDLEQRIRQNIEREYERARAASFAARGLQP